MNAQPGSNRLAVPPPDAGNHRTVASSAASDAPSPTSFVAKVVFAAIDWRALATIGGVSVTLLLFASVTSDSLSVVLGVTGLVALVGLRLSAMDGRWAPGPPLRVYACAPSLRPVPARTEGDATISAGRARGKP